MRLILLILLINFYYIYIYSAILRVGNPLRWNNALPHLDYVRKHGVKQFSNQYLRLKDIETPLFFWGDEVEYGVLSKNKKYKHDNNNNHYDLSLRADSLRSILEKREEELYNHIDQGCLWQPEYGSWMIETVPKKPFSGYISDLFQVEPSLRMRRRRLHLVLDENEIAPSVSNFPMLGVDGYSHNRNNLGPIAKSKYISDEIINPHPRFGALTSNIRSRRGETVNIELPLSKEFDNGDKIEMDAMAFGMGCTCLQVTLQAKNDRESRFLHDQLAIVSPLLLSLSASTPFFRGHIVDRDVRWDVIAQAVDDRTIIERGEVEQNLKNDNISPSLSSSSSITSDYPSGFPGMVANGTRRINKSRYSSVSRYLAKARTSEEAYSIAKLNDIDANIDDEVYEELLASGLDENLCAYMAHLFIRDPLVIFDDAIENVDDRTETDHFDNIQSTNWRSVRWKLPCSSIEDVSEKITDSTPGWRVELRTLETQLTDYENTAFLIFTVLFSRAIMAKKLNFYIPMSCLEENFVRAQTTNAALESKFWMNSKSCASLGTAPPSDNLISMKEMSLDEIFNGRNGGYSGMIPLVLDYVDSLVGSTSATKERIANYLKLLSRRASGELPTTAQWLRKYVENHPAYNFDGKLNPMIVDDMMQTCEKIGLGELQCPSLVGEDTWIEPIDLSEREDSYLSTEMCDSTIIPTNSKSKSSSSTNTNGYVPKNQCSSRSRLEEIDSYLS